MQSFSELAQSVIFRRKGSKLVLSEKADELQFIGNGRSAVVFRVGTTNKVLKVFLPPFIHIAKEEAEIYKALGEQPFYPKFYEVGPNYLVIDYIEGHTLFNCLLKGVTIEWKHIKEIDYALILAKTNGLNPSDIHLRNIFITPNGSIKIIDVARFRQRKTCSQWSDLKKAYSKYYQHKLFPKKVPAFFLNLIAFLYKKSFLQSFFTNRLRM
ncbi:protein kinase family protein [Anaerobacillus isosaccharinicus]|uniref:Protein kinase family protein n=1 Tax=Anaerobacillus isosaccharinicus TaxID=1532552 RepID=A0A7S7L8V4_9BACI|nr:protein kinase family protein [Anaerobacillus isosaccharinicus]MBA5585204.1 protein kinase family protein [Anaerobacillus isosaccharinicus]QOY36460.1 protein kinase family protein [Anaerobacillus isosaccharinicus]